MREKIIAVALSLSILLQLGSCFKDKNYELSDEETILVEYLNTINDVDVSYNINMDFYKYKEIKKMEYLTTTCKKEFPQNFDYFDLYLKILENSDLKLDKEGLSHKEELVQFALREALLRIYSCEENINDDFCLLQDTKLIIDKIDREYVTGNYQYPENVITIDYDKLEQVHEGVYLNISFAELLTMVVRHEINHVRQKACMCRYFSGQSYYDISYKNIKNNLIEASAESEIYNEELKNLNQYPIEELHTYPTERDHQTLFLMLGIFKDGFSMDKYYDAIFSSDINKFHQLFELTSKSDYETFYKILLTLNVLDGNYSLTEETDDVKNLVGNDYKIDIFKIVVSDLIKKITKENISFEDALHLYSIVKGILIDEECKELTFVSNSESYDEEFLRKMGIIHDVFYEFIIDFYKVSKEDIRFYYDSDDFIEVDYNLFNYFILGDVGGEYSKTSYKFLQKYPMIKELLFCNNGARSVNCELFDQKYELLREKTTS